MFPLNVGLFFLSIPIPGFVPSDRFVWNGLLSLSLTDRQKRPDPRTQALKTNENKINSRIILSLFIRLRCSCLETRSLLSVVYLFLSLTGGTPHYVRQTPPVGRSEKVRRHSPELQWSPIPITSD